MTTTSSVSTNSIDVASVVSQLMSVANRPLQSLENKVATKNVMISDLGVLKSNITSLRDALKVIETPSTYKNVIASSNNSTAVSVIANSGAPIGRYNLTVSQTAEASSISVTGFSAVTDTINLNPSFSLTIGSTIYDSSSPITTLAGGTISPLTSGISTLSDLNTWINSLYTGLGSSVSSSIVQTSSSSYALVVNGLQTGMTNAVSFTGLATGTITTNLSARDARLTVNGLQVERSTNTISDVVSDLTFNLLSPLDGTGPTQSALITVGQGSDNSSTYIQDFISAYNKVINQYKSMTINPINGSSSSTPGSFADAPGMLSFISDIKQLIAGGALTQSQESISLTSLGMNFQLDGTLTYDSTKYDMAKSNGILTNLSKGISLGGVVGSSKNLSLYLADITNPGGTIYSLISIEKNNLIYSNSKISTLNSQLSNLEKNYIQQYSNLNSLLYKLNQTSSALTSSLDAVTNINSGK